MGTKRDKLVQEYLKKDVEVGDSVIIEEGLLRSFCRDPHHDITVTVKRVLDDGSIVVCDKDNDYREVIKPGDYEFDTFRIGANPFPKKTWRGELRTVNYDISTILGQFGVRVWRKGSTVREEPPYVYGGVEVSEVNYNPYVFDREGNKEYYQRDYCWTFEQEQLFIESIYQEINCGMIVVRKRNFNWIEGQIDKGNNEVSFLDVVDGKQRIHTLIRFVFDEFQDLHGNYFSDLSEYAKVKFCNSMVLTYGELGENATDDDVIATFLGVNYMGVPMSKGHIDYVKEIQNKLK